MKAVHGKYQWFIVIRKPNATRQVGVVPRDSMDVNHVVDGPEAFVEAQVAPRTAENDRSAETEERH